MRKFTQNYRNKKMATPTIDFEPLRRMVRNGDLRPVYLLHGAEGYYIDELVKCFESAVPPEDRDFGLSILYAPQESPGHVIDVCRQMPMITDRQIVILKEVQAVKSDYLEALVRYVAAPTPTTVFVVASRGSDIRAKKFTDALAKAGGLVYQSKPVYESAIPQLVTGYIKERGLNAEPKSVEMLRDYIGTDLSRLYNEIDKLVEILGKGAMITPEAIERNIGVSKDYNSFELIDAIATRNLLKIYAIADYFAANPRQNPVMPVTASLFNFFADLLTAYYAPDKSDRGLMEALGLRNSFALRRVRNGMANYNAFQVVDNLSVLRRFDVMSKGVGSRQDSYSLLRDTLFRIVTTSGR